jgi:hypothetical protein
MEEILLLGLRLFFCINNESKVDVEIPQIIHCMLCYEKLISFTILKWRARSRKGLVSYFKNNGTIVLKKHVDANHNLIARNFEEEVNNNKKNLLQKQLAKKGAIITNNEISKFFGAIDPYKNNNVHQKKVLKNLGIFVLNSHLSIKFVENMLLKHMVS